MRNRARHVTVTLMARRLPVPALDLILAVIAFALALAELFVWNEWSTEPRAVQIAGVAVTCCALALRRAAPLVAPAVALMGVVVLAVGGDPPQLLAAGIAGVVIAYTIAAELDGRELLAAAGLLAAAVVVRDVADPALNGFDIAIDMLWSRRRLRRRQGRAQTTEARWSSSASSPPISRRTPSVEERERIAREMHDVIAHGAERDGGAGRRGPACGGRPATRPPPAVGRSRNRPRRRSRDMRRLLGALRDDDEPRDGPAAGARGPRRARQHGATPACRSTSASRASRVPLPPGSTCRPTGSCRRASPTCSSTPAPPAPRSCAPTAGRVA